MIVELPIVLVNKAESTIMDDGLCEKAAGMMLIDLGAIQNVFENKVDGQCCLESINGSTYVIRMSYEEMKRLWFKLIMAEGQFDFVTYEETSSNDRAAITIKEVVSENFTSMTKENVCSECGGSNLDGCDGGKKCTDCGAIKEIKIRTDI